MSTRTMAVLATAAIVIAGCTPPGASEPRRLRSATPSHPVPSSSGMAPPAPSDSPSALEAVASEPVTADPDASSTVVGGDLPDPSAWPLHAVAPGPCVDAGECAEGLVIAGIFYGTGCGRLRDDVVTDTTLARGVTEVNVIAGVDPRAMAAYRAPADTCIGDGDTAKQGWFPAYAMNQDVPWGTECLFPEHGADPTSACPSTWQEPEAYEYDLVSTCGEQPLVGEFRATVVDGRTTRVVGRNDSARAALDSGLLEPFPTVGDLLARADEARATADVVEVQVDPNDGSPTIILIDWSGAIDDESCFTIEIRPLARSRGDGSD